MDEGLLHKKLRTLEQQRAQSDDLNALLTREGGLNESQYMTCKNLKAAVAVSKQPGFFEYHKHSAEVQRAYDRKTCNQMVKKIARTQQDLDAIEEDIRARPRGSSRSSCATRRSRPSTSGSSSSGAPRTCPSASTRPSTTTRRSTAGRTTTARSGRNARTMKLERGAVPALLPQQSRRPRGAGWKVLLTEQD